MTLQPDILSPSNSSCLTEEILDNLYKFLQPNVMRWVYFSCLPSWRGQEHEIVQDIVQETMVRLSLYSQQSYVYFPERMCLVIAKRYYLDLKRKDFRIDHIIAETFVDEQREFSEVALENVFYEQLFILLATEISKFPEYQKEALLKDLASRVHFGTEPTVLQRAFLNVGIDLNEYRLPIPLDFKKRSQYSSLLYHAYRRLMNLESVQQFI